MSDYFAKTKFSSLSTNHSEFEKANKSVAERVEKLLAIKGKQPVNEIHKKLGKVMWDFVGMGRNEKGLKKALKLIPEIRKEFWNDAKVVGDSDNINIELEKAERIADFLELSELLAFDALHREESCGGHFREEYQTSDGEALRNDKKFAYVSAWEFAGDSKKPKLNKESLTFEYVKPSERSYK
jgi:succinate dehydrogenase / fumarate reductase flavoprotein subunit